MIRTDSQHDAKKGDTSQVGNERVQVTMSGAQPSQTKRKTTQVEETRKKMKYTKEDPVMTLTKDNAEFVTEKV